MCVALPSGIQECGGQKYGKEFALLITSKDLLHLYEKYVLWGFSFAIYQGKKAKGSNDGS